MNQQVSTRINEVHYIKYALDYISIDAIIDILFCGYIIHNRHYILKCAYIATI